MFNLVPDVTLTQRACWRRGFSIFVLSFCFAGDIPARLSAIIKPRTQEEHEAHLAGVLLASYDDGNGPSFTCRVIELLYTHSEQIVYETWRRPYVYSGVKSLPSPKIFAFSVVTYSSGINITRVYRERRMTRVSIGQAPSAVSETRRSVFSAFYRRGSGYRDEGGDRVKPPVQGSPVMGRSHIAGVVVPWCSCCRC